MERYSHLLTFNAIRKERMGGREYLVAPIVMLVPGVLNGSKGPLYYPGDEIGRTVDAWNGMPLTLGHPTRNGLPVSGRDPRTFDSHGLGFVFGTSTRKDGALVGNGWFDVQEVGKKDPRLLTMLKAARPVEVSTGLYTDNVPARNGAAHNGRGYVAVARNYRPDHLAILLDQQGACSISDGCGVVSNVWSNAARAAAAASRRALGASRAQAYGHKQRPEKSGHVMPEHQPEAVEAEQHAVAGRHREAAALHHKLAADHAGLAEAFGGQASAHLRESHRAAADSHREAAHANTKAITHNAKPPTGIRRVTVGGTHVSIDRAGNVVH